MAYPEDLDNVAVFKIHPAIGVARLANNEDFYEFFDYEAQRRSGGALDLEYMSVVNGKHWMKRQAVQFKIFAYDAGGVELGEVTSQVMENLGLSATWRAEIANRKLNNWSNGSTPVVAAQGSATGADAIVLEGDNPWHPGKVTLGTLTGRGLFLPPKGGVYRETEDKEIPPYGAHESDNGVLDTTSDGSISVELGEIGDRPVIPACVLVAPQDHSPDVSAHQLGGHNKDFVRHTRELLGIEADGELIGDGYAMDLAMMATLNADYNPGMEICLAENPSLEDPAKAFYQPGKDFLDKNEIRPSYETGHADHGALTAGLCSTWQTDLNACLNWWTAEYPNVLNFEDDPDTRFLSREKYAAAATAGNRMEHPELLNAYIDMMGVGRDVDDDPDFLFEKERDADDNVASAPQAPFPLEPPTDGTV